MKRKRTWLDDFEGEQATRKVTLKKLFGDIVEQFAKLQAKMGEVVQAVEAPQLAAYSPGS